MAKRLLTGVLAFLAALIFLMISVFYTWMPMVSFSYIVLEEPDHKERRKTALLWGSLLTVGVILVMGLLSFFTGHHLRKSLKM